MVNKRRKNTRQSNTYKKKPKTNNARTNRNHVKTASSSRKKRKSNKGIVDFFKNETTQRVLGIFFITFALYLLIAFSSYFFAADKDLSKLISHSFWYNLFNSNGEIVNYAGALGAAFAHIFIFKGFGVSAYFILVILFCWGLNLLFQKRLLPLNRILVFCVFFILWMPIFNAFVFGAKEQYIYGIYGSFTFNWLCGFLAKFGTVLILVFIFIAFITIFYGIKYNFLNRIFSKNKKEKKNTISKDKKNNFKTNNKEEAAENKAKKDSNEEKGFFATIIKKKNKRGELIVEDINAKKENVSNPISLSTNHEKKEDNPNEFSLDINNKNEKKEQAPISNNDIPFETKIASNATITTQENTVENNNGNTENDITDDNKEVYTTETLFDPTLDLRSYQMPSVDLLESHGSDNVSINKAELEENKNKIIKTLIDFKINIDKITATVGPTVTLYEIVPSAGIRISKIKNLEDDIALSLSALGIRIIAPIPGRGTIGIEVPNQNPEIVSMKSILVSEKFQNTKYALPIGFGKTISNETYVVDLAKMPHLLMAGATGQGKSVGLNVIITSLLYKKHPAEIKFVLVDPKKVELTLFNKIERHYLAKLPDAEEAIITDVSKVVKTLNSLCIEMDERYELLKTAEVRNLKEYNEKFIHRKLNPENGHRFLPYIILVVDEFADLIMTAGKEIEAPIARLAQLARAIGIHLIIATQRPSVNIITGTIKANFPARIAFRVTSAIDSKTILDSSGANQLIGRGDMLMSTGSDIIRLQCAFVDTPEIEKITGFIGSQRAYPSALILPEVPDEENSALDVDLDDRDALFDDAARILVATQQGSTSLLQRKLKIGYNRAGRLIDQLEAAGIVGPFEGSKARAVLISDEYSLEQLLRDLSNPKPNLMM